jgi:hypothetical protein
MWLVATVTTASPTQRLRFKGRGSLFPSGTFGGGTVEIFFVSIHPATGAETVSTTSAYSIDGTTIKTADLPSGEYNVVLTGSTGGSVTLFYSDQKDLVRS